MTVEVRAAGRKPRQPGVVRFRNGGTRCCFNYTEHLEHVIRSWCLRYPQLQHIDMDRVVVSVVRCRSRRPGVYAAIASLRYPRGRAERAVCRTCRWPVWSKNGADCLYLLRFFLPRFHNLPVHEKVATILHELHHIHPRFNGEFRRFEGRNWAHGRSRKDFERLYSDLKSDIMEQKDSMHELFLETSFATLMRRFGDVYGLKCSSSSHYAGKV